MDTRADPSDCVPADAPVVPRSLDHLAGFLRVIRVPRADIRAMIERAPAGTDKAMAASLPAALDLGHARDAGRFEQLDALPEAIQRLYVGPVRPGSEAAPRPEATAPEATAPEASGGQLARQILKVTAEQRAKLALEAVANYRAGRLASAIMLVVAQIDGIAADIPPTPGAALPFLIDDARDWDAPGACLDAPTLAAHPGSLAEVARLMRTSRPDTNVTTGLHRHGVMHGRDLGFDTPQNAARAFALLDALIAWATPIADARRPH